MCYVLKFRFDDSYKACKFTAFPRTFQIINYLFFKEVYNPNNVRILSSRLQQVLKSMSLSHFVSMNLRFPTLACGERGIYAF